MQERVRFHDHRIIPVKAVIFSAAMHVLALLLSLSLLCGAQEHPTQSQVKAAYLFNFGKFVHWHPQPPGFASFDICVLGRNPFGSALATTVAGERIDGKSIVVRNISTISDAARCQILFVSSSEEKRLKSILGTTRQPNVLTVSDIPGFAQRGGMIELVSQEDRIRFEVNVAAVGDAGLAVSSELLKVAVKVIGDNQAKEMGK